MFERTSLISNEANVNLDGILQCQQFKSLAQHITKKITNNVEQYAKGKYVRDFGHKTQKPAAKLSWKMENLHGPLTGHYRKTITVSIFSISKICPR